MITKAQIYVALRIIYGYRTVSTSLRPIDLLAMERKKLYASMIERMLLIVRNEEILTKSALKKKARMMLFNKWQEMKRRTNGKMDS